jgi:hypothetical protein
MSSYDLSQGRLGHLMEKLIVLQVERASLTLRKIFQGEKTPNVPFFDHLTLKYVPHDFVEVGGFSFGENYLAQYSIN